MKKRIILIASPILALVSFVVTYYIDPLKYTSQSPLASIPAFLLSIIIIVIGQTLSIQNEVDQVSKDSSRIFETVKDHLSITKMGTPKSAWEYIINNLPELDYVQNTSFNFGDEKFQSDERLYYDDNYKESLKLIGKQVIKGLNWKDIGDESALTRFRKISEYTNSKQKCKGQYVYKIIKQSEPQIGFIILTYKGGKSEVLFNWDFRDIPKDPVVLLSRDEEILNMFGAQHKGLWRVAVDDYDNMETKSTS